MTSRRPTAFSSDPLTERSLRHSIRDGVYFSAMTGAAESYFSAYAIHLNASTTVVGLLASLPPMLAAWMQPLSAWLGRRTGRRRAIVVTGALLQALCLIPLALIPLVVPAEYAPICLLPIVFLYFCGPNVGAPQWNSLVGDLLPESRRGRFFALRTRLSSVASIAALGCAGIILEIYDGQGIPYWGFVTIFALAMVARLLSARHLQAMHEPTSKVAAMQIPRDGSWWRQIRNSPLPRFSLFYAAMQFAVAISGPYFTLYLLRDLHLSYLQFMIVSAASVGIQFLTLNRWGRLSDLFGNRLILISTGCLITVIPSLWLISTNYLWLLAVQIISGVAWAGFTLSATAFVFDLTPAEHRATLFAAHNVLAAIAVFLGASLGAAAAVAMPERIEIGSFGLDMLTPLYGLFALSCIARLAVAAAFLPHLKEVRRVRPMSVGGLIFRVTRMHPISGVVYDVVGRLRGTSPPRKGRSDQADTEAD